MNYKNITTKQVGKYFVINYEVKAINGWKKREEAFKNPEYGKNYAESLRQ